MLLSAFTTLRDIVDQLDDAFRHHVAGRRLASEKHGARHRIRVRIGAQPVIARHDVQQVQQLPLVLVDALHLHVEQRVDVDVLADAPLHFGGEPSLVVELDVTELATEAGIVGGPAQALEFFEVIFPGVARGDA